MILDELLMKIGLDIDDQALNTLTGFIDLVGSGANKVTQELEQFLGELNALDEAAESMSGADSFNAYIDKLKEADEKFGILGGNGKETLSSIQQEFEKAGGKTEDFNKILLDLIKSQGTEANLLEHLKKKLDEHQKALNKNKKETGELANKLLTLGAAKYGVDALTSKFELLGIKIGKLPLAIGVIGAAFSATLVGMTAFTDKMLTTLDELHQLSNVTGESAGKIYELGKIAEVNGSSMSAAQSSISGLSKVIGEAINGTGLGAKAFEHFGLKAKDANGNIKSTAMVLEDIRQKMVGMSDQQQIAMLAKLGIDASLIQTLRLTNEEMAEATANVQALTLGVGNPENAKTAAAFKDSLTEFSQMLTAIGEFIALRFAPVIQSIIDKFKSWFIANNNLIKNGLAVFADSITAVVVFFSEFIGAIDNIISSTLGWENTIYILGGALLWLSRKMLVAFATNPLTWIIAGITAIILLVDDFLTYLQGGESYFGKAWQPLVDGLKVVQVWIRKAQKWVGEFIQGWKKYLNVLSPIKTAFDLIWGAIEHIWGAFTRVLKQIFKTDEATGDFASSGELAGEILARAFNAVALIIEAIGLVAATVGTEIGTAFEVAMTIVIGLFKVLGAIWDALVEGWTTGEWLNAFSKMFDRFGNIVKGAWDNLKRAGIEFINSLIAIVNKFGAGIKPIEIPIRQTVETIGEATTQTVKTMSGIAENGANLAQMAQSAPKVAASGIVDNSKTDKSIKNSNNKITTHITVQGSGHTAQDAKVISSQVAQAVNNTLSTTVI